MSAIRSADILRIYLYPSVIGDRAFPVAASEAVEHSAAERHVDAVNVCF